MGWAGGFEGEVSVKSGEQSIRSHSAGLEHLLAISFVGPPRNWQNYKHSVFGPSPPGPSSQGCCIGTQCLK